jgi:hypothetical protein
MAEEYIIRIKADESAQNKKSIPVAVPSKGGVSKPSVSKKVADDGEVSAKISNMVVKGALVPAVTTAASTSVSLVGLQTGTTSCSCRSTLRGRRGRAAPRYTKASRTEWF